MKRQGPQLPHSEQQSAVTAVSSKSRLLLELFLCWLIPPNFHQDQADEPVSLSLIHLSSPLSVRSSARRSTSARREHHNPSSMSRLPPNAGPGVEMVRYTGTWIKSTDDAALKAPPKYIKPSDLGISGSSKDQVNGIVSTASSCHSYTNLRRGNEAFSNPTMSSLTSTEEQNSRSWPS